MAARLPAIFFGHGNPMNALSRNPYTEAWRRIGEAIPAGSIPCKEGTVAPDSRGTYVCFPGSILQPIGTVSSGGRDGVVGP